MDLYFDTKGVITNFLAQQSAITVTIKASYIFVKG